VPGATPGTQMQNFNPGATPGGLVPGATPGTQMQNFNPGDIYIYPQSPAGGIGRLWGWGEGVCKRFCWMRPGRQRMFFAAFAALHVNVSLKINVAAKPYNGCAANNGARSHAKNPNCHILGSSCMRSESKPNRIAASRPPPYSSGMCSHTRCNVSGATSGLMYCTA